MTTTPSATADRLYGLLPAIHRIRDAERGFVLRELIEVLAEQVEVLEEDLEQLYDDQFIETCAPWVAPYIGDLIGYRPLHGVVPEVASPRAEVANTIRYRRRKGTASMLEQLARDVTGWPSRAVEFFEHLVTTQYMNHPRQHALATPDLRDGETLTWLTQQSAAFDDLAHTADVRRITAPWASTRGRHNIPNIGIFLWRIDAVRIARSPLVPHTNDGQRFRIDALGSDSQLFAAPRTEEEITHLAAPYDVPLPLQRRWLHDHRADYYGPGRSLLLEIETGVGDPVSVDAGHVLSSDLSDLPGGGGAWAHMPAPGKVAVDPVLGRVYLGAALAASARLLVTHHQGVAVPVGAGGFTRGEPNTRQPVVSVSRGAALQPHLVALAGGGTLRITDSDRYAGTPTITTTTAPPAGPDTELSVRAADHTRPILAASSAVRLAMGARTSVVLDGLTLTGGPLVVEESGDTAVRTLVLRHCTLVPGHSRTPDGDPKNPERASLIVLDPFTEVRIERCVLGAVVVVEGARVSVHDSVIDASSPGAVAFCGRPKPSGGGLRTVAGVADHVMGDGIEPGGDLVLHESTVVGGIHATRLDASNSLLVATLPTGDPRKAAVWARRRQVGCVRFSYVPPGSRTGRRHRCQPEPGLTPTERLAVHPQFTSLRFGDPAYLQLMATTAAAIRRGADDESEMGVTHLLFAPQREDNLLLRLDEYVRFGLEAGFFYAT